MKSRLLGTVFAFIVASLMGNAQAALILDITETGSGGTRWQFSGSGATVTSAFATNGFYGKGWTAGSGSTGLIPLNSGGLYSILSGSGNFFVNNTSFSMGDVNLSSGTGGGAPSPRHRLTSNFSKNIGDILTWSGDIVTDAVYSKFNPGQYVTTGMFSAGVLGAPLVVNVGPQSEVPVPAAVWLFGSGLLGLIGIARRKKVA